MIKSKGVRKTMKKWIQILCIVVLMLISVSCSNENNRESLEEKLKEQADTETIMLDRLTEFEWENVYFIAPYASKSEVQNITGIKSDEIIDNISDESVLYLIFTKDDKIVYQIYGRAETLGFDFEVGRYDHYIRLEKKDSVFSIDNIDGEKIYTLKRN